MHLGFFQVVVAVGLVRVGGDPHTTCQTPTVDCLLTWQPSSLAVAWRVRGVV